MMHNKKIKKGFLRYVFSAVLAFVGGFFIFAAILNETGKVNLSKNLNLKSKEVTLSSLIQIFPGAYTVLSGSMEPAIKTGSVVITYPQNSYAPGDIVTFTTDSFKKGAI